MDTPPGSPEPELSVGGRFSGNRTLMRLHTQTHAPLLSLTRRHVRARGCFSGRHTSPPELPAVDLQAYAPGFLVQHLHHPLLSIFLFGGIYFQILLDFSSKSDTTKAPLPIWSCFVHSKSTDSIASVTLY